MTERSSSSRHSLPWSEPPSTSRWRCADLLEALLKQPLFRELLTRPTKTFGRRCGTSGRDRPPMKFSGGLSAVPQSACFPPYLLLEGTARYAGQFLAPEEHFGQKKHPFLITLDDSCSIKIVSSNTGLFVTVIEPLTFRFKKKYCACCQKL